MITVISFVIIARLISTKEMGIWAVLQLMLAVCSTFFTWFPQAVTKFVAEYHSKGSVSTAAAVFYQALRANVIIYIPVIIGFYFGASFLTFHLFGIAYPPLFQILAFDVFVSACLIQLLAGALLGLRMFREIAFVGLLVGGIFRQILIISFLILLKNFMGLVLGWLVSDTATAAVYLILVVRVLGGPRFDFPLRRLLRYYLPLELGQIVAFGQTWVDRVLLVIFVSLSTLGIYNAAVTAFGVLTAVGNSMVNMLFPAYSSIREGNELNMRNSVRLGTRYASLTLIPLAFVLLATAKPAITLLVGPSYVRGWLPLSILCFGFALTAFTTGVVPVFLALEETSVAALVNTANVVVSATVAYALLPVLGIVGVSIGRAMALVVGASLVVFFARRKITLTIDFYALTKTFVAGGVMAAILCAVQLVHYSRFLLPLYWVTGLVVYLVMLRLLKAVDVDDLNLLRGFFGKRLGFITNILAWILLPDHQLTSGEVSI